MPILTYLSLMRRVAPSVITNRHHYPLSGMIFGIPLVRLGLYLVLAFVVAGCLATTNSPRVISWFGETDGRSYPHTGTDYAVSWGTPVLAVMDGQVSFAMYDSDNITDGGHAIYIRHGYRYKTYYMHLMTLLVKSGQRVKRGDVIALSGNTGRKSGLTPHLHFQVRIGKNINPYPAHWYGGKGVPLAYNPNDSYLEDAGLTHPIAIGAYKAKALAIAEEILAAM